MVTGSEIIIIDVMWDDSKNGGTFCEIVRGFNDPRLYSWRCFGCGKSYKATVKELMWKMERLRSPMLNGYCPECTSRKVGTRFIFESAYSFMSDDLRCFTESTVEEFNRKGSKTTVFITRCQECGSFCFSTLNTFEARSDFICSSCYARRNRVKKKGSIASVLPDIIPWYSDKNPFPPEKVPMDKLEATGNSFLLICPRCGKEHIKRLDAIVRGGAYCEQCNHVFSQIKKSGSLKDRFPEVAKKWDEGGNTIPSYQVTPYSSEVGYFKCQGNKKITREHVFKKEVASMVQAFEAGKSGCPVCAGFEVQSGINDFETMVPSLAKYWDYSRNDVNPSEVYYNSEDKFFFMCKEGHSFKRDPSHMRRSVGTSSEGCPICHGKAVIPGVNDLFSLRPDVMSSWVTNRNASINPKTVPVYSNKKAWFRCINDSCKKEFISQIDSRCMTLGLCPDCRKKQYSEPEKELAAEVRSWGFEVLEEHHITGNRQSFDIFIPEKNVAIEYNGLYWHSDSIRTDHKYHFKKCYDCKKIGITLIHVWADDYEFKRDIVLSMLKRKLGVSSDTKVNARECCVYQCTTLEAREFLTKTHIQGFASGSKYLALKYENEIVCMGVFKQEGGTLHLIRYSSSCNVRGGLGKLIAYVERTLSDSITQIVTFSDVGISDGNLYKTLGFDAVSFVDPDYSYVVDGRRVHKFNFRKDRFKSDPSLKFIEGLSESELASINKLVRVWDCGKIKWVKQL